MSKSPTKSHAAATQILLDTNILSKIVSDIIKEVDASPSRKSACLNRVAARIAGPKHNWGFLTGHGGRITANGLSEPHQAPAKAEDPIRKVMPYTAVSILWDVDTGPQGRLPRDVQVFVPVDAEDPEDFVSNYLFDTFGISHDGFTLEPNPNHAHSDLNKEIQDAAIHAFAVVCEMDSEIQQALNEGIVKDYEVDIACLKAASTFIHDQSLELNFITDVSQQGIQTMITDVIIDEKWAMIHSFLDIEGRRIALEEAEAAKANENENNKTGQA